MSAAATTLRTAQIYAMKGAKSYPTGAAVVAVIVGDHACEPHAHGLRASREQWVEIFAALADADPFLAERMRTHLAD